MDKVLFAAIAAALGVVPGMIMPLVAWGLVVSTVGGIVRRARGLPPQDPDADPSPAEHLETAIAFGLAAATGAIAALLGGWALFPGARPGAATAIAIAVGSLAGLVCGAGVRMIPAAAGFSIQPAVFAAAAVAAVAAAVGAGIG